MPGATFNQSPAIGKGLIKFWQKPPVTRHFWPPTPLCHTYSEPSGYEESPGPPIHGSKMHPVRPRNKYFSSFRQLWVIKSPPYFWHQKFTLILTLIWMSQCFVKMNISTIFTWHPEIEELPRRALYATKNRLWLNKAFLPPWMFTAQRLVDDYLRDIVWGFKLIG